MKRKLLIFLMFFAGYAYLASTLELDREECKQNYAKEIHSYATSVNTVDNLTSHIDIPIELQKFVFNIPSVDLVSPKPTLFSLGADDEPPDKLYLFHSSLLI